MGLVILVILALFSVLKFCDANSTKPDMNSKRTHELVDEAFMEQKDVLLDMLESKLKEVRDKKKHKSIDRLNTLETKCNQAMAKTGELKLTASGISAVGEIDAYLKFGESGKGTLKLDAAGISNVGKSHLDLSVEDGNVHIPGINDLLVGNILSSNCNQQTKNETQSELKNLDVATIESRRNELHSNDTVASDIVVNGTETHNNTENIDVTTININETIITEAPSLNGTETNVTVNAV